MKEIPVGGEIRIRCVEDESRYCCEECVFYPSGNKCRAPVVCNGDVRKDKKTVHFELVENTEPAPTRITSNQKIDIVNSFYTCQDKWVAKRTIEMVEEILKEDAK